MTKPEIEWIGTRVPYFTINSSYYPRCYAGKIEKDPRDPNIFVFIPALNVNWLRRVKSKDVGKIKAYAEKQWEIEKEKRIAREYDADEI